MKPVPLLSFLFGLAISGSSPAGTIRYAGVNLAGAEFGSAGPSAALPGTFGIQYTYPNQSEVDYFRSRGMNIIRLPFRWERLQHATNSTLDAAELDRLNTFVSATTAKGVYVILDPHNFQRYYPDLSGFDTMQSGSVGLVGSSVPDAAFADFWSRVAALYKGNDHVMFNLMNEPNNLPITQLVASENAAIAAIRAAGATNLILVPGSRWTGAWTWLQSDGDGPANAEAMLNVVDPADNYAFDVHQYLDSNGSGSSTNIVSPTVGADRLAAFTQWLHDNHQRGFLGEFAVANITIGDGIGDEAISNMLSHVQNNADVWLGWTWWAAGPWWGNYMFTLEPAAGGSDRPAMGVLRNFIPIPAPRLVLTAGNQFQFETQPGFNYQLQVSPGLNGGDWTDYGSVTTGDGGTVTVTLSGTGTAGFYRVRVGRAP